MAFHGADPDGLHRLAEVLESRLHTVARSATEAHLILDANDRHAVADRVSARLLRLVHTLGALAGDLARRAEMVQYAERIPPGSTVPFIVQEDARLRARFALVAPFGVADWSSDYLAWRDGPAPASLAGLSPAEVHAAFVGISSHAHHRLVLADPQLIGGLDGAPPELRYLANRIQLQREIVRLEAVAGALDIEIAELCDEAVSHHWIEIHREVLVDELSGVAAQVARYRRWIDDGRQILLFDSTGDGRVAEVFGDLDGAEHVGVVVPGITTDISNFGPVDVRRGFRTDAAELQRVAGRLDDRVATIAWLGYDTPDGADAMARHAATSGHDDLIRFVDGLVAAGDRHVAVIGHSYGSLVVGMAAGDRMAAHDVVFVGSPGTSLDHAGDANLPPGGDVWAGLATWDPIGAGVSLVPADPWEGSLSLPGRYVWDLITSGDLAAEQLWHGRNPAHESFGAVEFTTDGATGHSQYFDPGTDSLENLARIVAGLASQVTLVSSEPVALAPGPMTDPLLSPGGAVV